MEAASIALQRLYQQRLLQAPSASPEEIVAWFGAVQSQDYAGGKWALGLRMQGATDDVIDQAFNEGRILRTHVMRPTWHFVTPADIRWMLALTAPRVKATMNYMNRQVELNEAIFSHANAVIAKALEGGKQLTRAELGTALAQAGIDTTGLRLAFIVGQAELEALICSGPRRGKQFTYMLLEERAPQARSMDRDESLTELTRRYFTGHGPATVNDFAWWSGLTITDAKAGTDMLGNQLCHEVIDGKTYWYSASMSPQVEQTQQAFLLPTYDEFLVGFAGFDKLRRGDREVIREGTFDPSLVIGDKVAGSWRRTLKKGKVIIELFPFKPLTAAQDEAVAAAAKRYGDFLCLSVEFA